MILKWRTLLTLVLALVFVGGTADYSESRSVPRMSVDELNERLNDGDVVVIDVRADFDWNRAQVKIVGAVRENPYRVDWAEKYSKNSTLVLYCT